LEKSLSLWKRVRRWIEARLCRAGFWIGPRLSHSTILGLAQFLGCCAYHLAFSQRRVALANLDLAFGNTRTAEQKRQIARSSFQSFARTSLETLGGEQLLTDKRDQRFDFSPGALDLLDRLVSQKRGLIALTFHYGNWEWLSLAWGMAGYPVTVVAQPIKNPEIESLFRTRREQAGHRLVHRRHAARQLYKILKRGGNIGLLVDLNSSMEEGGAFFDFFGVPALTTRVVGFLAMRTGAPIVCSVAYPQEDGRYRVEIGPGIPYDLSAPFEEESNRITRCWLAHCEEVIRRKPEFWMWMYKRWKVRPGPEPGRHPFYSFHDPQRSAMNRSGTES